jgi:hypothetical protein
LCKLLGSEYCYFNPPDNIRIHHPCIIYRRLRPEVKHADNTRYATMDHYRLTVISTDPDYDLPDKIADHFMHAAIENQANINNLSHTYIDLYY